MTKTLLRTDRELEAIYDRQMPTLYRVCFAYMKNAADTEDAVQETFFKLIGSAPAFENHDHEKAWLLRTAANVCKNNLRNRWRQGGNLEDFSNLGGEDNIEIDGIFSVILTLPEKYKIVVYLYYYEGYNSGEIAKMLAKKPSTVRNHLHEARAILRNKLGGDFNEK